MYTCVYQYVSKFFGHNLLASIFHIIWCEELTSKVCPKNLDIFCIYAYVHIYRLYVIRILLA